MSAGFLLFQQSLLEGNFIHFLTLCRSAADRLFGATPDLCACFVVRTILAVDNNAKENTPLLQDLVEGTGDCKLELENAVGSFSLEGELVKSPLCHGKGSVGNHPRIEVHIVGSVCPISDRSSGSAVAHINIHLVTEGKGVVNLIVVHLSIDIEVLIVGLSLEDDDCSIFLTFYACDLRPLVKLTVNGGFHFFFLGLVLGFVFVRLGILGAGNHKGRHGNCCNCKSE